MESSQENSGRRTLAGKLWQESSGRKALAGKS